MTPLIPCGTIVMRARLPFSRRAEQSMGMPAVSQPPYWTAEMVREIPDDLNRYECIDGELFVTPSQGVLHQAVVGRLFMILAPYIEEMGIGAVLFSPLDAELDDGMIVQPDLLAFRLSPPIAQGRYHGRDLFLTIEVLTFGTATRDRGIKRAFYARIGVGEYWIVHPKSRLIERWRAGASSPTWEDGQLVWQPEGAAQPLTINLPAFFDSVPEVFRGQ